MPLLPTTTLLYTHSLTTVTASYLLLISPSLLTSSTPIWLLSESMHVRPSPPSFDLPSEPLAAIALVLSLSALTTIFFASGLTRLPTTSNTKTGALAESAAILRAAQSTWLSLSATRVLLGGAICGWIYIVHRTPSTSTPILSTSTISPITGLGLLANGAVFTACLADMLFWGYVWTNLKEEGRELALGIAQRRENVVLNDDGTVSYVPVDGEEGEE